MSEDIEKLRKQINDIDRQMTLLFEERMHVAAKVAAYKKEHQQPVLDSVREQQVIKQNCALLQDRSLEEYYVPFVTKLMSESKDYQKRLLKPASLQVKSFNGSYPVYLERGGLDKLNDYFSLHRKVLLLTDENVAEFYLNRVLSQLNQEDVAVYIVKPGEISKSSDVFVRILEFMVSRSFTRTDCVLALGGGVVGDLAGFVASVYMRGIDFYNIPTSLLSQVDSSIGGKTAIDLSGIKNVVGSFYPPKGVLIDSEVLKTLPNREFFAGMAEVIKEALCFDPDLLALIQNSENPLADADQFVFRSLKIKKYVVEHDERESGLRKSLNFGHTFGHAIESLGMGRYLHGEAVSIGMLYCCEEKLKPMIQSVLIKYHLPYHTEFSNGDLVERIKVDKKAQGNQIEIVYLTEIGKFELRRVSVNDLLTYKGL